ncbi:hypothetical protein C1J00_31825 [Streptomyces cahuitamycinicus]|uniref:Uncharacterized protein n=1 Tax=Streptomyces cahuitamycinicus TaxID=2070367 RepID=A0A2N8TGZ6_9ACTN|nr:hypothetical protein C1J00_31825 [Streptomyces cahuitamycinicus]
MLDLIRSLLVWVGLLASPSRRRRATAHPPGTMPPAPFPEWGPLPAHRSPYGLNTLLDGTSTVTVRPYLAAHEQRRRRHELTAVSLRPDLPGPCWIERTEVA